MLNNLIIQKFIDDKQQIMQANLNHCLNIKDYSNLKKCLNGICIHDKIIKVNDTIILNESDYSLEKIRVPDNKMIEICLNTLNILSSLNDILFYKQLLSEIPENEIILINPEEYLHTSL